MAPYLTVFTSDFKNKIIHEIFVKQKPFRSELLLFGYQSKHGHICCVNSMFTPEKICVSTEIEDAIDNKKMLFCVRPSPGVSYRLHAVLINNHFLFILNTLFFSSLSYRIRALRPVIVLDIFTNRSAVSNKVYLDGIILRRRKFACSIDEGTQQMLPGYGLNSFSHTVDDRCSIFERKIDG